MASKSKKKRVPVKRVQAPQPRRTAARIVLLAALALWRVRPELAAPATA